MKRQYCSRNQLYEDRKWTLSLIIKYLEPPDKLENSRSKNRPKLRLYSLKRVSKIEKLETFKIDFEKAQKRKLYAKKAIKTKTKNLLKELKKFEKPKIEIMDKKILYIKAIKDYNKYWEGLKFASLNSPESFLNRIAVNYIRHNISDYEDRLSFLFKKVGKANGLSKIRQIIYDSISEAYPFLKEECDNQKESRELCLKYKMKK